MFFILTLDHDRQATTFRFIWHVCFDVVDEVCLFAEVLRWDDNNNLAQSHRVFVRVCE